MPLSSNSKHVPYMREHSKLIRCLTPNSHITVEEDSVISNLSNMSRSILTVTCRNKQRQLQYAWQRWLYVTDVRHDYKKDVITILSRSIPEDELRTELEVEVIFKWVLQNHYVDPTGLAYTIFMCRSKTAIVNCIQQCRLEKYPVKCPILLQNDLPRSEEGHFTVLTGQADILIFPPDSLQLLQLHSSRKNGRGDEEIQKILDQAIFIDTVKEGSGFGELSTITKMKRAATVRSSHQGPVEVLVIPDFSLIGLLEHRRALVKSDEGNTPASAEVMDYLRQSGLVYKAAMVDVMEAASCMVKTHYQRGSILFKKGDLVDRLYIVLYGEILLDTKDYEDGMSRDNQPFQDLDHNRCHLLKSGSIIGDEGMVGNHSSFESSALVVSETATFFEVWGFGISFLASRLGVEKYSALVYKSQSLETGKLSSLNDDLILHSTFNSLRKSIAMQNPYRGKTLKANRVPLIVRDILVQEKEQEHLDIARLTGTSSLLPNTAHPISRSRPASPTARSPGKKAGGMGGFGSPARSFTVPMSPVKNKQADRLPAMHPSRSGMGSPDKKAGHQSRNRPTSGRERPRSRSGKQPKSNIQQSHHGPTLKKAHVLSAAAMHHVQGVLKMVKKRDLQQMRMIAQSNVVSATQASIKKRKEDGAKNREPTREEMRQRARMNTIEDKFQRALAAYVIRNDEVEEVEPEPVIYYGGIEKKVGLLEVATGVAIHDFDEVADCSESDSVTVLDPRYMIKPGMSIIEQYLAYVKDMANGIISNTTYSSYDIIDGNGSQAGKRPPNVPPLLRLQSSIGNTTKQTSTKRDDRPVILRERFARMSTIYTVGTEVLKVVDKDGNTKVVLSRGTSTMTGNRRFSSARNGSMEAGGPISGNRFERVINRSDRLTTRSEKNTNPSDDSDKKALGGTEKSPIRSERMKKSMERQQSHPVEALDKILAGEGNEFTSGKLKNIFVPEHLWETRFMRGNRPGKHAVPFRMKSNAEEISKADLLNMARASVQRVPTVEDETKPPESMREKWFRVVGIVMAQNAARREGKLEELEEGQSLWRKQPVDNLKDMMDAKEKILKTYQDVMDMDPSSCKYTDGRKKSSKSSRFRLGNIYDRKILYNDLHVPESVVVDADMEELVRWKQYSLESTQNTKTGPTRTLPVLANHGSHSLYWGKQVVTSDGQLDNSDESLLLHSLKKMTTMA